ncbi:MAG: hypothetical protein EOO15_19065 [Chitinophagaceae bacterium]|nr:MAG: hypothetical protein EOO15_19065 [Chitinophagaceae bacterium]
MSNKVNVTPLHDRVIVKPAAAEEKTAGGIIIGTEISIEGADFLIMRESDILAIV